MAAINYPKGIDELCRWMYKQVVKCPAGNDNRARVRPLSHASLDSHSWLSVLPGKGCSRKRPSAFLGRCFVVARRGWTRESAQQAGYRRERTEPLGTANASTLGTPRRKQIVGYSLIKSAAGIKPGRHHKAPFCRQGAATPAKHRMSSGREAQRYNSATPQAVRLEASLPKPLS